MDNRERMKLVGQANRKHEEICDYCGADNHYAKGLCRNCYARLLRKGTVEKRVPVVKIKPDVFKKRKEYILEHAVSRSEVDDMILALLKINCTYKRIGEVCHMSKQAIAYHIERMLK